MLLTGDETQDKPAKPPGEICKLINQTDVLCVYMCPYSGLDFIQRPHDPHTKAIPANDNCPKTIAK